eukprot:6207579-Pleurochrysis_carterae.AAC.2
MERCAPCNVCRRRSALAPSRRGCAHPRAQGSAPAQPASPRWRPSDRRLTPLAPATPRRRRRRRRLLAPSRRPLPRPLPPRPRPRQSRRCCSARARTPRPPTHRTRKPATAKSAYASTRALTFATATKAKYAARTYQALSSLLCAKSPRDGQPDCPTEIQLHL